MFGLYSVSVKLLSLSVIPGIYVQKQMKFSCTNLKLDITLASDVKRRNSKDLHFLKIHHSDLFTVKEVMWLLLLNY